jgi:hypothetical protein
MFVGGRALVIQGTTWRGDHKNKATKIPLSRSQILLIVFGEGNGLAWARPGVIE